MNTNRKSTEKSTESGIEKRKKNLKDPWEPGESGNPKGKTPGTLSLTTILKKKLSENNEKEASELIDAMIKNAKKGMSTSLNITWDRVDGPIVQEHKISGGLVHVLAPDEVKKPKNTGK